VLLAAAERHSRGDEGSDAEAVDELPALGECDRRQSGDVGRKPKRGLGDAERFRSAAES
jgi:hypothetical protein